MRLVIVDDSDARVKIITAALSKSSFAHFLEIVTCDSADKARLALNTPCDLLVLDVVLPKKSHGTPQAKHSVDLLSDICNPRKNYIRPRLIVGLTADVKELQGYQDKFAKEASVVLRGQLSEIGWIDSLLTQVESLLGAERKILQQEKDRVLISVHGIRTYGPWQGKLSSEISQYSRSVECVEIKFGFLNIFSFAVPYFRRKVVRRAAERLRHNIQKYSDRDVYIVAHSFGTLVVSEALRARNFRRPLKAIILCGSPLPHDENIEHIVSSAELTLNECGTRDLVLILARLFVWGLGDAGRTGFEREHSREFFNRYFRGGHSLYFKNFEGTTKFYEKFWLKVIAKGDRPVPIDSRQNYFGEDVCDLILNVLTFLKPIIYILLLAFLFGMVLVRCELIT